ncbi:MAG: glutamyl-tRNA reductase [Planctomycetes bacterium RBG_13_44_8b]|nr:MAG: glutamyl-tRNA reductase [Planctomycetes bacterium RBG_13_44_8b]
MKLVLNRITYHNCPVEVREKVSFSAKQRQYMFKQMHAEQAVSEAVILETCNRLEFYLYAKKDFNHSRFLTQLIKQVQPDAVKIWKKYSIEATGKDAVQHLFEVSAGLDSQMLGENQILSQVKSAYKESTDCKTSKMIFHRLFHQAFRSGKAVRTDTHINCGAVSIGLAAVELARKKLDISAGTAMVIGAGENAELVAKYLLKSQPMSLFIANRNKQKAKALQKRLKPVVSLSNPNVQVISLAEIVKKLNEIDLIISSTASVEPVVTYDAVRKTLARRRKPLLIIDIAVPRDIDPRIGRFKSVTLYNIDDLNKQISSNINKRNSEIPKAQAIVDEFTDKFMKWYDSLSIFPAVSRLMQKGVELAHSEAKRYSKDFGQENSEKLKFFAESLVKKVLHGPISYIKNGGEDELSSEQLQAVDMINKMFLSQDKH